MASISDSEEENIQQSEAVLGLQPYMFEPEREILSESDNDSDLEAEDNEAEAAGAVGGQPDDWRLGNTDWCECGMCGALDTARECICCREMSVLEDKLETAGRLLLLYCVVA